MNDWSKKHRLCGALERANATSQIFFKCFAIGVSVNVVPVRWSLTWHSRCSHSQLPPGRGSLADVACGPPPPQALLGIFVVSFWPTLTPVTQPVEEESPALDAGDYEPLADVAPDEQVCPEYRAGLYSSTSSPPPAPPRP